MQHLCEKRLGKMLHTRKTQPDVPSFKWYVNSVENIIPDGKCQTEIHTIPTLLRNVVGVVPNVHFRTIK